jgi:hypothetical protein
VHGICTTPARAAHTSFHIQVAFGRGRWTNAHALICHAPCARRLISFGVQQDTADSKFTTGMNDPHRDFTAIRNRQLLNSSIFRHPSSVL